MIAPSSSLLPALGSRSWIPIAPSTDAISAENELSQRISDPRNETSSARFSDARGTAAVAPVPETAVCGRPSGASQAHMLHATRLVAPWRVPRPRRPLGGPALSSGVSMVALCDGGAA